MERRFTRARVGATRDFKRVERGKNLLDHVSSTCDEARTDAEKFNEADRMERAA